MLSLVAVFGEVPFVSAGATQIVFGAGQFFEEFVFEMAEIPDLFFPIFIRGFTSIKLKFLNSFNICFLRLGLLQVKK